MRIELRPRSRGGIGSRSARNAVISATEAEAWKPAEESRPRRATACRGTAAAHRAAHTRRSAADASVAATARKTISTSTTQATRGWRGRIESVVAALPWLTTCSLAPAPAQPRSDLADCASVLPRFSRVERGAGVVPHALQLRPGAPHPVRRQRSTSAIPRRGLCLGCSPSPFEHGVGATARSTRPVICARLNAAGAETIPPRPRRHGAATVGDLAGHIGATAPGKGGEPALTQRKFAVHLNRPDYSANPLGRANTRCPA